MALKKLIGRLDHNAVYEYMKLLMPVSEVYAVSQVLIKRSLQDLEKEEKKMTTERIHLVGRISEQITNGFSGMRLDEHKFCIITDVYIRPTYIKDSLDEIGCKFLIGNKERKVSDGMVQLEGNDSRGEMVLQGQCFGFEYVSLVRRTKPLAIECIVNMLVYDIPEER